MYPCVRNVSSDSDFNCAAKIDYIFNIHILSLQKFLTTKVLNPKNIDFLYRNPFKINSVERTNWIFNHNNII